MNRRGFLLAASAAVVGGGVTLGLNRTSAETSGTLRMNVPMRSEILGMDVLHTVYLPPDHSPEDAPPVLYLLHGGTTDDNTTWARSGDLKATLDTMISARRIPPVAVLCPDARRDPSALADRQPRTYYMNDLDGQFRWEDMFVREFIPKLEEHYGVGGHQAKRAISGYSMGGYGALLYATLYPSTFVAAAGLSSSHRTDEQLVEMSQEQYEQLFGEAWGYGLEGEERLNEHERHYNLVDIIHRTPPERLRTTGFYLDVGSSDEPALAANAELREAFTDQRVDHEFATHPGAHDWDFWRGALSRVLEFAARRFPDSTTGSFLFEGL
ncbi:alpha/beta hydrolase-fold protein [Salinifilum aidingensis]